MDSVQVRQLKKQETLLDNGFSVQLLDHPGSHPVLWVVSNDNSTIEIALLTNTGQTLMTMQKAVYPGGNFINIDVEKYPKAVYLLKVRHAASGKTKTLKLLN